MKWSKKKTISNKQPNQAKIISKLNTKGKTSESMWIKSYGIFFVFPETIILSTLRNIVNLNLWLRNYRQQLIDQMALWQQQSC